MLIGIAISAVIEQGESPIDLTASLLLGTPGSSTNYNGLVMLYVLLCHTHGL